MALSLGQDDEIYVLNRTTERQVLGHRVCRLNLAEEFLGDFGQRGEEDGQFIWAFSVACHPDGRVFVSDEWLNRISIFSREGQFLGKWGSQGSNPGELNGPAGLVFESDGNLLVADGKNHRIQRFTADGEFVAAWGSFGDADGQFNYPWGINVDGDGNVYVADWRNDRIQKFLPRRPVPDEVRLLRRWRGTVQPPHPRGCGLRRRHLRHRLGQQPRAGLRQ